MSEAKDALIAALEKSADQLEAIVGTHDLPAPMDSDGWRKTMNDPNWKAKWKLVFPVTVLRGRAKSLRRGDIKQGDWPPFRPEEAQMHREQLAQIRNQVVAYSPDRAFQESILKAISPLLEVVEKYAVMDHGIWRFKEEDCDPMPKWENPPAAGT